MAAEVAGLLWLESLDRFLKQMFPYIKDLHEMDILH